jgi:hypothetical protein
MSLSKSKCWYSNNCLHFQNCAVSLIVAVTGFRVQPTDQPLSGNWGARKLTGENLKLVQAEFSTIS